MAHGAPGIAVSKGTGILRAKTTLPQGLHKRVKGLGLSGKHMPYTSLSPKPLPDSRDFVGEGRKGTSNTLKP